MRAEGRNGTIVLEDDAILIGRSGVAAFLTHGLKGDKRIPLDSVTAVQFKAANPFINGYLQFSVLGGVESRGGAFAAANDENTVMFTSGQAPQFEALKAEVEQRIRQVKARPAAPASVADELEKLASLRDRGILTQEEFDTKKRSLLGL